jgi:phage terminase large subunit GpA-like protein
MTTLTEIRTHALAALIPPPRLHLSEWIEQNIRLPEGVSALPGAVRLWEYQRGIADAISEPEIERVTLPIFPHIDIAEGVRITHQ